MGHYCRICGRGRPNEKFSAKGYQTHSYKDCMRLPREERQFVEEEQEIGGFLTQANISKKNLARLKTLTASPNPEIAAMADLVMEIGKAPLYKRKQLGFLARKRRALLDRLEDTGLIHLCRSYWR